MKADGFEMADADKCHQKWRNILREYHSFRANMTSMGRGRKEPSWFCFKELDDIFGERPVVHAVAIIDTLQAPSLAAWVASVTATGHSSTLSVTSDTIECTEPSSQVTRRM